jgi:hypothetical protein
MDRFAGAALRRIAQFYSKILPDRRTDRRKTSRFELVRLQFEQLHYLVAQRFNFGTARSEL